MFLNKTHSKVQGSSKPESIETEWYRSTSGVCWWC